MQVGVSTETLEVSCLISGVWIKAIRAAAAKGGDGVRSGCGAHSGGRFGWETCKNIADIYERKCLDVESSCGGRTVSQTLVVFVNGVCPYPVSYASG